MKKINDLIKDVERDLVINLTLGVRREKITFEEASQIARDFIDQEPFTGFEDLFKKLYILSEKHKEIRKVFVKYSPIYFNAKSEFVLNKMRFILKEKEIEKAINFTRRAYA